MKYAGDMKLRGILTPEEDQNIIEERLDGLEA